MVVNKNEKRAAESLLYGRTGCILFKHIIPVKAGGNLYENNP
jgi:hypothetical protein